MAYSQNSFPLTLQLHTIISAAVPQKISGRDRFYCCPCLPSIGSPERMVTASRRKKELRRKAARKSRRLV